MAYGQNLVYKTDNKFQSDHFVKHTLLLSVIESSSVVVILNFGGNNINAY